MFSHTVLLAADVRRIAKHARAANLSRQVSDFTLKRLDPDGLSLMSIDIPLHNDAAEPAHHRVTAYLRVKDTREPQELTMDVLADDWDTLPEAGGVEAKHVPKEALRALTQKWIAQANHPQYTKRPDVRDTMIKCATDLQKLIRETR